ncbi:histidine utilization repressor, partial [Rhizobium ruizarguesonis]
AVSKKTSRKAKAEDSRSLELPLASSFVEVVCIHNAGMRPFCREERLISRATVPEAANAEVLTMALGPGLLNQVPGSTA